MTVLARESYAKGPAGDPVTLADTVFTNGIGAVPVYAASAVDGGTAALHAASAGTTSADLIFAGSRTQLVHSWYVTFDDGTTTAGNAILSGLVAGATTVRGEVTRRTSGKLALREGQTLRAETAAAYGPGTYRLVHAANGASQSLTVRRAGTDEVLETITAALTAGGFDRTRDGFVNPPGGTLRMTTDQHAWDTDTDPGPYVAPAPSGPSWTYRAGGVDRPVTAMALVTGGTTRDLTATTVRRTT